MLSYQAICDLQRGQILLPFTKDISRGTLQVRAEINEPKTNPKVKRKMDSRSISYSGTHSAQVGMPVVGLQAASVGKVQFVVV